jgi:hypothetical protein
MIIRRFAEGGILIRTIRHHIFAYGRECAMAVGREWAMAVVEAAQGEATMTIKILNEFSAVLLPCGVRHGDRARGCEPANLTDYGALCVFAASCRRWHGFDRLVGGTVKRSTPSATSRIHRATRNNYFESDSRVARLCYRMRKVSLGRAGT